MLTWCHPAACYTGHSTGCKNGKREILITTASCHACGRPGAISRFFCQIGGCACRTFAMKTGRSSCKLIKSLFHRNVAFLHRSTRSTPLQMGGHSHKEKSQKMEHAHSRSTHRMEEHHWSSFTVQYFAWGVKSCSPSHRQIKNTKKDATNANKRRLGLDRLLGLKIPSIARTKLSLTIFYCITFFMPSW